MNRAERRRAERARAKTRSSERSHTYDPAAVLAQLERDARPFGIVELVTMSDHDYRSIDPEMIEVCRSVMAYEGDLDLDDFQMLTVIVVAACTAWAHAGNAADEAAALQMIAKCGLGTTETPHPGSEGVDLSFTLEDRVLFVDTMMIIINRIALIGA
ncbi:MAG TPA: hypothetical protein DCQ04_16510 [Actinobacteria bacterium]|nr:hypothetical protein [Actinomycetota bacterium]